MRIRSIRIGRWRNFENIQLNLDAEAPLVCVVGANGTGKSHLLELIAACAHWLGLSQGIEIPRGDPFADQHDFSLKFYLAEGASNTVDQNLASDPAFSTWDRTLTLKSSKSTNKTIVAGGVSDRNFAN